MLQPARIPLGALIETLFDRIAVECAFLRADWGLEYSEDLRALTERGEIPVQRRALPDNTYVLARAAFASRELQVEFAFDNFDYHLHVRVARRSELFAGMVRHELWLWLGALETGEMGDAGWLTAPERMHSEVERAARLLASHLPRIRLAGDGDLARIEERWRAPIEAERSAWAEQDHQRTAALAAAAFRAKDFARVVSLLEQIEWRLSPSERRKLAYARGRACA
jgi:hypothetical protein